MAITEKIKARKNVKLTIQKENIDNRITVSIRLNQKINCMLHWAFTRKNNSSWILPPDDFRPEGTRVFDNNAVQSSFVCTNDDCHIELAFPYVKKFSAISFVLFFPDENKWDNNKGKNFSIEIPSGDLQKEDVAVQEEDDSPEKELLSLTDIINKEITSTFMEEYAIDKLGRLSVGMEEGDEPRFMFATDIPGNLYLHWGVSKGQTRKWLMPPESIHPPGSVIFKEEALRTPFEPKDGVSTLVITIKDKKDISGLFFLLVEPENSRWLKNRGSNFYIPLYAMEIDKGESFESAALDYMFHTIVENENNRNSWTLMHRFNLCYDLTARLRENEEALTLIYVWLRFSAMRQLEWQRRYNTKPRELSHSQDRLNQKFMEIFVREPSSREMIRLILTTIGRGGEGQRIRDEILHIMHRHKIKEVAGHFMEEWHQKLHNNTTPDDIVICNAYLDFQRSDGDLKVYYKTLGESGVTKERLAGFDRPIVTEPDFVPHLKEGLIHDFENYLRILKDVHEGTDLETAIKASRGFCTPHISELIEFVWNRRNDSKKLLVNLVEKITEARREINVIINSDKNISKLRALLYLDLALEEYVRVAVERNIHTRLSGNQLVELMCLVLENLRFSHDDSELADCFRQWERLKELARFNKNWSLKAKSVIDRLRRVVGKYVDRYYNMFQPKAERLGKAVGVQEWSIPLFSEEVIRGRPSFVLSMILYNLDPVLRKSADLGDWQVISTGMGSGRVEVVETLITVQGKTYDTSTVIIADKVLGTEDIPDGITAVITPDVTDIVSHVAVRARNCRLLFATCYDDAIVSRLKAMEGKVINLAVNSAGDVVIKEGAGDDKIEKIAFPKPEMRKKPVLPEFSSYIVPSSDFTESIVGGKSLNLKTLQGKVPEWIHLPQSIAIPFGIFEKSLSLEQNSETVERYNVLISEIENNPQETLYSLRETVLKLEPPEGMLAEIEKVMKERGFKVPEDMSKAWLRIKQVWASKWNERAYLSRKAMEIPQEELFMAVLIQEVIEADYAFVIHTVNPFTGKKNELFAEVVLGLGETLVGNYPGRALGFTSLKDKLRPNLLSYPNKSIGLYSSGMIFRSDSNGEDLSNYAGAGLYDSVTLEDAKEVALDYTDEPIIWDEEFKLELLVNITKLGAKIEKAFGSPQDIEGVYSKGKYYVVQTRPQVGV